MLRRQRQESRDRAPVKAQVERHQHEAPGREAHMGLAGAEAGDDPQELEDAPRDDDGTGREPRRRGGEEEIHLGMERARRLKPRHERCRMP